MVCKISNFDARTAKHLAQASCTELTCNFVASSYKLTIFKGFLEIEVEYKVNIHYQIKLLCS